MSPWRGPVEGHRRSRRRASGAPGMAFAPAEDVPTGAQGSGSQEQRDIGDEDAAGPHPSLISRLCREGTEHAQ